MSTVDLGKLDQRKATPLVEPAETPPA
ncbi:MAG: hypothetical protein RI885_1210, partial [Actinomycetota bacterium]